MKIIARTVLLAFTLGITACSPILAWKAGEPFDKSQMEELDKQRFEQDQFISQLSFFGAITEEEMEELRTFTYIELGHYLGSKIAAAENDRERWNWHMEKRAEIQGAVAEILERIQERVEEEQEEPEAPKTDL